MTASRAIATNAGLWLGMFAFAAASAWATYALLFNWALSDVVSTSKQRLASAAIALESAVDRHERLPRLLTRDTDLWQALDKPDDRIAIDRANRKLSFVKTSAAISEAFLLDATGRTLASTNWGSPKSFIGTSFNFRPYFRDAIKTGSGRFYAVGVVTGRPGYFIAERIRRNGHPDGVIVVKVTLGQVSDVWAEAGDRIAAVDAAGVILLSAERSWLYRTLKPLDTVGLADLGQTRAYGRAELRPLIESGAIPLDSERAIVLVAAPALGRGPRPLEHVVAVAPTQILGWKLVMFAPVSEVSRTALSLTLIATAAMAGFATALQFYRQRQLRTFELREADQKLREAHVLLERRIGERTQDLEVANAELITRIDALRETERILRRTQDDAVQAGKLAALGQLSSGISHELNQPLQALTMLSDTAATLIDRGQHGSARHNLVLIREMVARMGRILAELKSFARKAPSQVEPFDIHQVVQSALTIVEGFRKERDATIFWLAPPSPLIANGDKARLQQVLVNLLRNAIDACATSDRRWIEVDAELADGLLDIAVRDSGSGLSQEVLSRLFEPFYTTKPAGEGLGLGLSLSRGIVRDMGGELVAGNHPDGGAEFVVRLRVASSA